MFRSRRYRYDNEQVVLAVTILLVLTVIILTSTVTFCVSGIFIVGMFGLSAYLIHAHHQSLLRDAHRVDLLHTPELAQLVDECREKLQPGEVDVFLVDGKQINAYTFGIADPKALVIYTPVIRIMTAGELRFVVGHEMGHVALGHTWLNTIVGGLAGIPAPFGAAVLLYAAFRWWNRMCEFSADRAGLLACGDLNLAVSALVRLAAPEVRNQREFEQALVRIDAEDDLVSSRMAALFQTHPMVIRRINQLHAYAATAEYHWLQTGVNSNLNRSGAVSPRPSLQPSVAPPPPQPKSDPRSPEERWPWLKRGD